MTKISRPLRVVVAHNAYQQRGGEDGVVQAECDLLEAAGHSVLRYSRHNDEIPLLRPSALVRDTVWSSRTLKEVSKIFLDFCPDVLHVHNTLPLISPSIYWAAHQAGVPVVQTLHNFRLVCPQAQLQRAGGYCEACVGKIPWRAISSRCYRGSYAQSAALALTQQFHTSLGTWRKRIAIYVTLSEFCQRIFAKGGIPADRIRVKPNFVPASYMTGSRPHRAERSGFLFAGRLTIEKGVAVLAASRDINDVGQLTVVGDGPARRMLEGAPATRMLGLLPQDLVFEQMIRAQALVVPSVWPETFGLVVIEAYAAGLPVIASRIGALAELVEHGETGLLVEPGNPRSLAEAMHWAAAHPELMARMGQVALQRFAERFAPERNLVLLQNIYSEAIALRGKNEP